MNSREGIFEDTWLSLSDNSDAITEGNILYGESSIPSDHDGASVYIRQGPCRNDDSIGDVDGDTCSGYYDSYPEECGGYDTEDFIASRECCVCGGGSSGTYFPNAESITGLSG